MLLSQRTELLENIIITTNEIAVHVSVGLQTHGSILVKNNNQICTFLLEFPLVRRLVIDTEGICKQYFDRRSFPHRCESLCDFNELFVSNQCETLYISTVREIHEQHFLGVNLKYRFICSGNRGPRYRPFLSRNPVVH